MHLDLRVPMGLLFSICGAILIADGLVEGVRVLDINVDLWWGVVMLIFGLTTLCLGCGRKSDRR